MWLEVTLVDWLRIGNHQLLLLLSCLALLMKTQGILNSVGYSFFENLLQILLRSSLLHLRQLLLA